MASLSEILGDDLPMGWRLDVVSGYSYETCSYATSYRVTAAPDIMCYAPWGVFRPEPGATLLETRWRWHHIMCSMGREQTHELLIPDTVHVAMDEASPSQGQQVEYSGHWSYHEAGRGTHRLQASGDGDDDE